jgi:hypothetical protein
MDQLQCGIGSYPVRKTVGFMSVGKVVKEVTEIESGKIRVRWRKERVKFENIFLNIISLEDLLDCKKKSDRLKDLADADELERMHKGKGIQ